MSSTEKTYARKVGKRQENANLLRAIGPDGLGPVERQVVQTKTLASLSSQLQVRVARRRKSPARGVHETQVLSAHSWPLEVPLLDPLPIPFRVP